MRRGDVYWVNLDPAWPAECNKIRPAVIVSNDGANRRAEQLGRGVLTVVPVTSNTTRIYPFQVLLPEGAGGLRGAAKAQAEQVRSVSVGRLTQRLGTLDQPLLADLDRALRLHLAL
ncbi:type II toxin-antitoxin system PemK/MazF family toxin [Actinocatenispora sera]|uniref:mRNA interferase n=1 Tax=Actinocatenispora sera TaxID=390989 RepID=A0A810L0X2_9ACTN|nr:type II toxin-antitoxin system PemK/MazF family toxin [Actinocatenispora sera]BCJ29064.1 mRNA interferase [Actinocatenispora sera]